MKAIFFAIMLMGLLVLGSQEVRAQYYNPAPYWGGSQYQPYSYPQQYDPYYDLHVLHYQLYLPQYPIYQSCCFAAGVPVLVQPAIRVPAPHVVIAPRVPAFRGR
jgi:hypothetical protein